MNAVFSTAGLRCSLFAVLMAGSLLIAQEKKADSKASAAAKKAQNRLPNNFAKLDLADDQKQKIRDIQASYDPKIDELQAQLKALKEKEQTEVEAVLTPDQLKQLTTIKAEAKKKSDDEKAAKTKGGGKKTEAEPAKKADGEKKPATEKKP